MPHSTTRRSFLGSALALSAGAACMGGFAARREPDGTTPPKGGKRVLILGGTGFLGPACVDAALAKGHTVTLFNRGITEKRKGGLYPDLEKLVGDRDPKKGEGLKALEGRDWDAVIDTSAYVPRIASASATLLAPRVTHYVLISTVSVYKDNAATHADETAEVGTLTDPTVEEMGSQFENYGPLKALCEQAAEKAMPGRVTNVRPGFIIGPGDPTPRFPYWPARLAAGGRVLVPGAPADPVQYIDVRDLGEWIVRLIESGTKGVFNAIGPQGGMTNQGFFEGIAKGVNATPELVYASYEALEKAGVGFPILIPSSGETAGFHTRDCSKAAKAGLTSRSIADTAKATLAWLDGLEASKRKALTSAVTRAQETAVLESLKADASKGK